MLLLFLYMTKVEVVVKRSVELCWSSTLANVQGCLRGFAEEAVPQTTSPTAAAQQQGVMNKHIA